MRHTFLSLLSLLSLLCVCVYARRVAIIGAGIAGASTAYYTRKYAGERVEIHVFEKTGRIGGRIKDVEFGGQVFEVGADAWSSVNEYIVSLVQELNVPLDNSSFNGNGEVGYYEGNGKFNTFEEDQESAVNLFTQIEQFRERLHANYVERANRPFQSVEEFTRYGGVNRYTRVSMSAFGSRYGIEQAYLRNEVLPVIRAIYDQDLNVSAFAGIVSLLPALTDAYAVLGGNSKLVRRLLASSRAQVNLNTSIKRITQVGRLYKLRSDTQSIPLLFDDVVIAVPFEFSNIAFSDVDVQPIQPRPFEHWFVTLILCTALNPSYFGNPSELPDNVFTTGNSTAPFVVVYPVGQAQSGSVIFKIFSNQDVTRYLNDIFLGVQDHVVQVWPYTFPDLRPQTKYQPVVLARNLYYTSGMESVATAMEISTIAGRNIALLIAQCKD